MHGFVSPASAVTHTRKHITVMETLHLIWSVSNNEVELVNKITIAAEKIGSFVVHWVQVYVWPQIPPSLFPSSPSLPRFLSCSILYLPTSHSSPPLLLLSPSLAPSSLLSPPLPSLFPSYLSPSPPLSLAPSFLYTITHACRYIRGCVPTPQRWTEKQWCGEHPTTPEHCITRSREASVPSRYGFW